MRSLAYEWLAWSIARGAPPGTRSRDSHSRRVSSTCSTGRSIERVERFNHYLWPQSLRIDLYAHSPSPNLAVGPSSHEAPNRRSSQSTVCESAPRVSKRYLDHTPEQGDVFDTRAPVGEQGQLQRVHAVAPPHHSRPSTLRNEGCAGGPQKCSERTIADVDHPSTAAPKPNVTPCTTTLPTPDPPRWSIITALDTLVGRDLTKSL